MPWSVLPMSKNKNQPPARPSPGLAFIERFRINLIMSLILTYLPHLGLVLTPVLFLLSPFVALEQLLGLGFSTSVLLYCGAILVLALAGARKQRMRYIGFLLILSGNIGLAIWAAKYVYV